MVDASFLGKLQCFDIGRQCSRGLYDTSAVMKNPDAEKYLEMECNKKNNKIMRCCPKDLINKPYFPAEDQVPIHVKKSQSRFQVCPLSIRDQCKNEKKKDIPLCVANKCNDGGYISATNYYEICKAYESERTDEPTQITDCPTRMCLEQIDLRKAPRSTSGSKKGGKNTSAPAPSEPGTGAGDPAQIPQTQLAQPVPVPQPMTISPEIVHTIDEAVEEGIRFYRISSLMMGLIAFVLIILAIGMRKTNPNIPIIV